MTNRISQREARALRKRVAELERVIEGERNAYAAQWPCGVHLGDITWPEPDSRASAVYTARRLGHAVVAIHNGDRTIRLYALPHPEVKP